ncbi:hypothetical protein [Allosphingosinicella sp.]|uniref:hypothetical protein n=1 Tax=Allosphingosinicella sp. TaxID=2823234 RepID=UPI0037844BE1
MSGGDTILVLAVLLAGLALLCFAMLRGWEDWLRLRRLELSEGRARRAPSPASQRLELLDLRSRVKRLEAIADGMED